MSTTVEQDTRHATYAAGLRALADFVEAHPELDVPSSRRFHVCLVWKDDPKAELAQWARATSSLTPKKEWLDDGYFRLIVPFGAAELEVFANREQVCERVVTGTETVTKTVPDPDALKAVPTVEVTEQVETVEWICKPLLEATS